MQGITITEALAEIKTIDKRLEKKREFVRFHLARQERFKDPLEKDGGAEKAIKEARQSILDLEKRKIQLRLAITTINQVTDLTVAEQKHTMAWWLVWKREVADGQVKFLSELWQGIQAVRKEARGKGVNVASGQPQSFDDVIINLDEKGLSEEIEALQKVLGDLDGQLQLKNATTTIGIE